MNNTTYVKEENQNKPATKKQLWALFAASRKCGQKHDYRADNLTMQQASELLQKFNAQSVISNIGVQGAAKVNKTSVRAKKPTLEDEFISYMSDKIQGMIATARDAIKIKSVVEDDPAFFPNKKDRKQYAFVGFGCGITIIDFDKRSKKGKLIKELSSKHHMTTFLKMFLKGFSASEIKHFESIGCPLQALFYQDIRISGAYEHAVASFMTKQGVKNVRTRTFDD